MAMHHLHLTEPFQSCRIGMSTAASFDGSRLIVEWKGQTKSCPASVGDLIFVDCWGGFPHFGKTVAPKRLDRLALWLVGVPREFRFSERLAAVESFLAASMAHHSDEWESNNWPRDFRVLDGPKWFVGMDKLKIDCRWRFVSGWAAPDITPWEVREMIEKIGGRWEPDVTEKFLFLAEA